MTWSNADKFWFQEGDTALNLVIKQDHLREDDVMYYLVKKILAWGIDTKLKDLVMCKIIVHVYTWKFDDFSRVLN